MMGHDWPYWAFLVGQSCVTGATTGYLCSRYVIRKADEREAWLQAELDKERARLVEVAKQWAEEREWMRRTSASSRDAP